MQKLLLLLTALLLSLASNIVQAQRRPMPMVDVIDVPVSLASSKALRPDQVRAAIVAATLTTQWDLEETSDGSMTLSILKDMEYRVTLRATYTATSYSLTYVSSENLKTATRTLSSDGYPDSPEAYASNWRATRTATQPEFKFAVEHASRSIHPTYELLLYELSASVRRHLRQM